MRELSRCSTEGQGCGGSGSKKKVQNDDQTEDRTQDLIRSAHAVKDT